MSGFDAFVALDWSGARIPNGIAVAEAGRDGPPVLVPPPGRCWTRAAVLDWMDRRLGVGDRPLIGIDAAFALPLGGTARHLPAGSAFELWDFVEARAGGAPDWYGGEVAAHPDVAADFWREGRMPPGFVLHKRATEIACRAEGFGEPDSPYKLIGSKQVGKGALAVMRVLRELKRRHGDRIAVWPFEDPDGRPTLAEIYPRLFLMRAGFGRRKLRRWEDVAAALERLGSPPAEPEERPPSDHEADALVAAAGLRWLAGRTAVWSPRGLDATARREGWIFGVGA